MSTFDRVRELPLTIESYDLGRLEHSVSGGFNRVCSVVRLRGGGEEGLGEDVTYDHDDQALFQRRGTDLPLSGIHSLESFSSLLDGVELFPGPPSQEMYRNYRRWAVESAALDLALRQRRRSLADVLGLEARPLQFVVSMRLGEPPSTAKIERILATHVDTRFKLDPTPSWDDGLIARLVATRAVVTVDFKGGYKGTPVDQPADPALYRRVIDALPDAWLEDPHLVPETEAILRPHRDRITWDAPIHSVADIESLPFPPKTINIKPSRFGTLSALFDGYDYCSTRGIDAYGGGQFELGVGRGQIQYLASLFHADAPNDVAPVGYHEAEPSPDLPISPLAAAPSETGFRWGGS